MATTYCSIFGENHHTIMFYHTDNFVGSLQPVDDPEWIDEGPIAVLPQSLLVFPGLKYTQGILASFWLPELLQDWEMPHSVTNLKMGCHNRRTRLCL